MGVAPPGNSVSKGMRGSQRFIFEGCGISWQQSPATNTTAQPILCLHSAGAGSREFRPLLDRRPPGTRLILVDWPGHGRSDELSLEPSPSNGILPQNLSVEYAVSVIHALLQHLGLDKVLLLGSGFGATVALQFAATRPAMTQGLVLCQPVGLVSANTKSPFAGSGKNGIRRLLKHIHKSQPLSAGNQSQLGALRQARRLQVLSAAMQPARQAATDAVALVAPRLRKLLESVQCPVFFALSHDNQEFALSKYMALLDPSLAWEPRHQFTVFAGAFNPIWDEPDRFAIALSTFVQAHLPVENHTHAWLLSAADYPAKNSNLWKCVHPDCIEERILPSGRDANESLRRI
jgi:pimeloyl-ACP methyl ester carboxylesterase